MKHSETYFEQVPIEVAETILRQAVATNNRAGEIFSAGFGDRASIRSAVPEACQPRSIQGTAMRKLIFLKSTPSQSWACSDCAWAFNPSGPPQGNSLDDMMKDFEQHRDKEFASHVCSKYPKPKEKAPCL